MQIEQAGVGCVYRQLDQVIIKPRDIILLATFDNKMISLRNRSIWNNIAYVREDLKVSYYKHYGERIISRCVDVGKLCDFVEYAKGNSLFAILHIYEYKDSGMDLGRVKLSGNVREWINSIDIAKTYTCRDKVYLT